MKLLSRACKTSSHLRLLNAFLTSSVARKTMGLAWGLFCWEASTTSFRAPIVDFPGLNPFCLGDKPLLARMASSNHGTHRGLYKYGESAPHLPLLIFVLSRLLGILLPLSSYYTFYAIHPIVCLQSILIPRQVCHQGLVLFILQSTGSIH